jgi:hypothetical protein
MMFCSHAFDGCWTRFVVEHLSPSHQGDDDMPEAKTKKAAAKDKRQGKSASTQAGEYVHEEMEHVRSHCDRLVESPAGRRKGVPQQDGQEIDQTKSRAG